MSKALANSDVKIQINGERLLKRLEQFAAIGALAGGGVNRPALSQLDRDARSLLAKLALERGFLLFQDDMANLFIRRVGRNGELDNAPPFVIGSHLDSQPLGGKFDGALGVLSAFEVLETLEDLGVITDIPVEVVAWTNEEGSRYAPGAMGSKAYSQGAIPEDWQHIIATDGGRFSDELAATIAALPEVAHRPLGAAMAGYLEVHIEQGPSLEADNIPIGVVTGVQATRWLKIRFSGEAAHAGTTTRAYRKDPLAAASALMNTLYQSIMVDDDEARFTIGKLDLHPGSVNTIPDHVEFYVDIRHPDSACLDAIETHIRQLCVEQAAGAGCMVQVEKVLDMAPAKFSSTLIDTISTAAQMLDLPYSEKVSGAFHDALFIADIAPSAMIFVPCRDGRSHCEDEYVEPNHSVLGAEVLLQAVLLATKTK